MSDPRFDPAMREALDRFTVPALSPDFADRVTAAALAREAAPRPEPKPASVRPSFWRDRRGGWARTTKIGIGVIAFGAMTAAAAATGLLGDVARNVPVIGPVIASIAPAPKPKPPREAVQPKPERRAITAVEPVASDGAGAPEAGAAPVPPTPGEMVRERVAQRIAQRIERRNARREAAGLPPLPPPTAEQIRHRIARMPPERRARLIEHLRRVPPEDRAAIAERVREIRQERAAAAEQPPEVIQPLAQQTAEPAGVAQDQAPLPPRDQRVRLTPEERAKLRNMLREARERRREAIRARRQGQ